jgi:AraC-like DNA-binding protein
MHSVSAVPLGHLVDTALARGRGDGLLAALGLPEDDRFVFELRLPEDMVVDALGSLADVDPDVALIAARGTGAGDASPVFHLSRAAETVADLCDIVERYLPLVWTRLALHTELDAHRAVLIGSAVPERAGAWLLQRYVTAEMCWAAPNRLAATWYPIRRIALPGPPMEAPELWGPIAEQVTFGARRLEIEVDRASLDLPLRMPNPGLGAWLDQRLERDLAEAVPATTTTEAVAVLVRRSLRRGPDRAEVARRLGWSERTLARRLAAEGRTFQRVVDDVRFDVASSWLPTRSVEEVSERLGFADVRSFQRAFRRWTGTTPTGWARREP